ncbi:MAG: histone methyltransferase set1 [Watsoniomyces obsoletus]|nr:MAG: histone methyltransferase set1 [Watsoniomyces obsoletus]
MLEAQDRARRTDEANAQRFEALERKIKDIEEKNNDSEKRFAALESSSNCFRQIQNRCISVYKRDRLQTETHRDRNIIGEGNVAASGPSAVTQAALYRDRVRADFKVFLGLYELDPEKVLEYQNDMPTLKVLERHAYLKIEGVEIPPELQHVYLEFVSLLETNGRQDYLHDIQSPEFRAYTKFWGISNTLVR